MSALVTWHPGATILIEAFLNSVWVDITGYVLDEERGQPIQGGIGRQNELPGGDPSNASWTLENRDGRFTPGNAASPLYPYWKSGVRIRWSETIGARTFAFPDLWLEIPEVEYTFEDPDDPETSDRVLRVQAVDLLTRLNRAPRFVSNMAAYILGQGKESLAGYWPLLDTTQPFANVAAGRPQLKAQLLAAAADQPPTKAQVLPAGGTILPGDDLPGLRLTSTYGPAVLGVDSYEVNANLLTSPVIDTGKAVTMVAWINIDGTYDERIDLFRLVTFDGLLALRRSGPTGEPHNRVLYLSKSVGSTTGSTWSTTYPTTPGAHIIAMRYDPAGGRIELWWDEEVYTANLTGTLVSDTIAAVGFAGTGFLGTMTHAQLYMGSDFAYADFTAQREIGLNGLVGQSVDQRIRTICNAAGIPDSQLDLEPSDSVMPAAEFAGRRPGDLATAAATTGGGILFTRGSQLVYHDRKHRFNQ